MTVTSRCCSRLGAAVFSPKNAINHPFSETMLKLGFLKKCEKSITVYVVHTHTHRQLFCVCFVCRSIKAETDGERGKLFGFSELR